MKSILKSIALVAVSSLVLVSCGKDYIAIPTEKETPNPMRGDLEMMVNDEYKFVANEKVVLDTTINGSRSITITARQYSEDMSDSSFQIINLVVANFQGPKSYPIDWYTTGTAVINVENNVAYNFLAIQGEAESYINFTEAGNGKYVGTFQFRARLGNSTEITSYTAGKFTVYK